MDLVSMRTFVAVADARQFGEAADDLDVTQQAVSKRIAALETELGVRLFTRGGRRVELTIDGQAFLPHARAVLDAVERAAESVRPGRRALRVDVLNKRVDTGTLLKNFHNEHPDIELDVVTLPGAEQAMAAVRDETIDAAFCTLRLPLPAGVTSMPAVDGPHELLVGPEHPFADARSVVPRDLVGHRIWIPGMSVSADAAAYYAELAASFCLKIDATGLTFGMEHLLDMVSESASLATFTSPGMRLMWTLQHDLRRIPIRDPELLFPFSLIWRPDNSHPALVTLRNYVDRVRPRQRPADTWLPSWARLPTRYDRDMPTIPKSHRDLLNADFATFATIGADGRPQLTEVWFLAEGETFQLSLNTARQKAKNLTANPAVSLFLLDLSNPYKYLEIRGDAEITPDEDYAFADRVAAKYGTDLRNMDNPGDKRVIVTIKPTRIHANG